MEPQLARLSLQPHLLCGVGARKNEYMPFFISSYLATSHARPAAPRSANCFSWTMPLQTLRLAASFEGIESVAPAEGVRWCVTLRDCASGEEKEGVFICADEEHELEGSRGVANFAMKWKDSGKRANISIVEAGAAGKLCASDGLEPAHIVSFECRGCEIVAYHPTEDDLWVVTSEGGTTFSDVALTEPDWCEYDEENDASVEITEIVFDFVSGAAGAKNGGGKRKKKKR